MLVKLMEVLKIKNDLKNVHKGTVVKNDDPLKLGRVKVTVKGLFEDISNSYEKLPWVTCFNPNEFGNDKGGAINVPVIGSKLKIVWLDETDIYFPYYDDYWLDKTISPTTADGYNTQFQSDYPNVYGYEDSVGNYEIVNKSQGFTERKYKDGYTRKIDSNSKLTDKALKEYIIEVLNKYQVDSNNILLGTGNVGHKQLVTKDHLDSKYNALLQFLIPLYTTVASTSIDPASVVLATALSSSLSNFIDSSNVTSETKAK